MIFYNKFFADRARRKLTISNYEICVCFKNDKRFNIYLLFYTYIYKMKKNLTTFWCRWHTSHTYTHAKVLYIHLEYEIKG